jgi:ATP-dependent DNA helicase RecG
VEDELDVGLFRVPVPNYDRQAFREGLVNALVHRDYTRLGATHIRWEAEGLVISNPGGFVEGVSLANLLVTMPRPRNPLLADIMKRVGLAERTGRGVDRIYEGLLRYGRPAPDYSLSDATGVILRLPESDADLPFLQMIIEEERRSGASLPIESLIVLSQLRASSRLSAGMLAQSLQRDEAAARAILGRLTEAGLVQSHGSAKAREYSLSAAIYRRLGKSADYVRQAEFDNIQQEQMIMQYVRRHGSITRKDVADLCRLSADQASRILRRLVNEEKLTLRGKNRGAYYTSSR